MKRHLDKEELEKKIEEYINLKNKEYKEKQLGYFVKTLDEVFEELEDAEHE